MPKKFVLDSSFEARLAPGASLATGRKAKVHKKDNRGKKRYGGRRGRRLRADGAGGRGNG
jgi:hypothetical protein